MIIVFMVVCIIAIIICSVIASQEQYDYEIWVLLGGFNMFCLIICTVVMCISLNNVKQLDILDNKIEMYQQENVSIENDIDELVKQYMEHEKSTFKEVTAESSITLINLYPDLKSNELVQQQLNIYVENNNKIKELKEHKLDYQVSKWWLYFGKVE